MPAAQQTFDFRGATLAAEIDRVNLSPRAKDFLRALLSLAEDQEHYVGPLVAIGARAEQSATTLRRAKAECLTGGVLRVEHDPGRPSAWVIDWGKLLDLPDAPPDAPRTARRRHAARKSTAVAAPEVARMPAENLVPVGAEDSRGGFLGYAMRVFAWLAIGAEGIRTPANVAVAGEIDPRHPRHRGAPLVTPTPATPATEGRHLPHRPPPPPPHCESDPRHQGAPPPPPGGATPATFAVQDTVLSCMSEEGFSEEKRQGRGIQGGWRAIAITEEFFATGPQRAVEEFEKLKRLGLPVDFADDLATYLAFVSVIAERSAQLKIKNRCRYYGSMMARGTWKRIPTPAEIAAAKLWIERQNFHERQQATESTHRPRRAAGLRHDRGPVGCADNLQLAGATP
jgi:hypothetical protein